MFIVFCWSDEDLYKINLRDPEIFEKLYLRYKKKIYNFLIIKARGNKEVADEIFSQTFHSALEAAPKLKNADNIQAWLLKIASRRFLDYLRNLYKEEKYLNKMHDGNMDEPEPFQAIKIKEEILMFNLAFNKIPELNKKILTMKYIDDKSQKEIAGIIQKSEKAVESLLSRSKKLLKKELGKYKRFFND
jgi:RNA polymerase sigma-70 factor, ECF subfamily